MFPKFELPDFTKAKKVIYPTVISGFLVILCICLATFAEVSENTNEERTDLYSVETADATNEEFTLGYGSIKGERYCSCYIKNDGGGKEYFNFETNKTAVYKDLKKGEQAYVTIITNGFNTIKKYELHIPENAVIKEMDLSDLK